MPVVELRTRISETTYHDPNRDFSLHRATVEIRYDPLTGQLVRIFPLRRLKFERFDWTPVVDESKHLFCPFCPDKLEQVTPRFPDSFVTGGRLRVGQAIVVPNLHPYELHTGVVVMSPEHYVPMEKLTVDFMYDSFMAGVTYLKRCIEVDPQGALYGSVNWNYMPFAGGSLIHPHLQVLIGPEPSNYDGMILNGTRSYLKKTGSVFWVDLVATEQADNRRYLGRVGESHWLATFAPRALADITAIFPNRVTPYDMDEQVIKELVLGLNKVIRYYDSINIPSFNVSLYFGSTPNEGFWTLARIAGRFTIFPKIGTDVSHLQTLHGDQWTIYNPEDLAAELKERFN